MRKIASIGLCAALLAAAGCLSDPSPYKPGPLPDDNDPLTPPTQPPGTGSENPDNVFDHDNNLDKDPWELLKQQEEQGPPEFSSRLHSCPKIKYATLGKILGDLGVNLNNTTTTSGGFLYKNADQALGVANYAARVGESTDLTTASAAKLFDIWVAAAPEIIANMPNRAECQVGGVGAQMFNDQGQCTADGITCLIGYPATATHLELCNQILASASTPERGRIIAVASLAAAAHTCE